MENYPQLNFELMENAKKFIQNGHIDDAIALVPEITTHFMKAEQNDPTEYFSIYEIYDALSPPVFARVLIERRKRIEKEELFNTPIDYTTNSPEYVNKSIRENLDKYILHKEPTGDHLIFKYIDDFVKVKKANTLSADDKEELAKTLISMYNEEGIMSTSFTNDFLNYDCDRVPDRFYIFHENRILDGKRKALIKFQKSIEKLGEDDSTNRWSVLSNVNNVKNAARRPENVPLIEFIRTFGGFAKPFNPVKYGFIKIDSSKPTIINRTAENAFIQDPECYFLSNKEEMKNGFIKFDLGNNVHFKPVKLYIDSRASYNRSEINQMKKSEPYKLDTRSRISKVKLTINNNESSNSVVFEIPDKIDPSEIDFPLKKQPFSSATFEIEETNKGADTFRITTLEVFGDFEL